MRYKNHPKAVYCCQGAGIITDLEANEQHEIRPVTLYALDKHDRHILKTHTELQLVCSFNPPVTGREVYDKDGAYALPEGK